MRPLEDLRAQLPRHLHLFATPTLLVLFCDHCGYIAAAVPDAAGSEEMLPTATRHRCPPAPRP